MQSTTINAADLLRQYAADDEMRADDDEKYSDGTHAATLRERARMALATADEIDRVS